MKSAIVIPARLASTRLPHKLLLAETGKTLIQHTFESAINSQLADCVIVAADDPAIVDCVRNFGGRAELTDARHRSGTDRLAEIARRFPEFELLVNWQGDEPELPAVVVDRLIEVAGNQVVADLGRSDLGSADITTACTPIRSVSQYLDPNCVKVVFDQRGRALYFSRSPIPHFRSADSKSIEQQIESKTALLFQHLGVYVYRREILLDLADRPQAPIEVAESLEQLRALDAGFRIWVVNVEHQASGIDTREDYEAFVKRDLMKM